MLSKKKRICFVIIISLFLLSILLFILYRPTHIYLTMYATSQDNEGNNVTVPFTLDLTVRRTLSFNVRVHGDIIFDGVVYNSKWDVQRGVRGETLGRQYFGRGQRPSADFFFVRSGFELLRNQRNATLMLAQLNWEAFMLSSFGEHEAFHGSAFFAPAANTEEYIVITRKFFY